MSLRGQRRRDRRQPRKRTPGAGRSTAQHGRSYYLATRLLPAAQAPARARAVRLHPVGRRDRRRPLRTESPTPRERAAEPRGATRSWPACGGGPVDDPLLPAVLHTIRTYDLDPEDFDLFLRSMAMDLKVTEYPTYDDLLGYMEGSAAVDRHDDAADPRRRRRRRPAVARESARQLGLAFQLTNFIRDVARGPGPGPGLPAGGGPGPLRGHAATVLLRRRAARRGRRRRCASWSRTSASGPGITTAPRCPGWPCSSRVRGSASGRRSCSTAASSTRSRATDYDVLRRAGASCRRARRAGDRRRRAVAATVRPARAPLADRVSDVRTAVVLFTRDLRVQDNPALAGAASGGRAGRARCSWSIRAARPQREPARASSSSAWPTCGSPCASAAATWWCGTAIRSTRRWRWPARSAPTASRVAADVSRLRPARRERRLAGACEGIGCRYGSFPARPSCRRARCGPAAAGPRTRSSRPYWRAWRGYGWRPAAPTPRRIALPDGIEPGPLPASGCRSRVGSKRGSGGETAARRRAQRVAGRPE